MNFGIHENPGPFNAHTENTPPSGDQSFAVTPEPITMTPGGTSALEHTYGGPAEVAPETSAAGFAQETAAPQEQAEAAEPTAESREVHDTGEAHEAGTETSEFDQYMKFEVVQPEPWNAKTFSKHLEGLGATDTHVTDIAVDNVRSCYEQSPNHRSYHGPDHGMHVGQPNLPDVLLARLTDRMTPERAQATAGFDGLLHDVGYMHVDVTDNQGTRAWPTVLKDRIGEYATYDYSTGPNGKPIIRTTLTEAGQNDPTTQMVAGVFGVGQDGVIHNQGGNEFVSAIAAGRILEEKGVPDAAKIGVIAGIAATVPFRPALVTGEDGTLTDGHMGELAKKVHDTLLASGATTPEKAWEDTNNIMLVAVHTANSDISPFTKKDNFAEVVHGGRGVKKEEIPELRKTAETIGELATASRIESSAPLLYGWLGADGEDVPVPAENVPHVYMPRNAEGKIIDPEASYPPLPVHRQAVENTRENAGNAHTYFIAHEASIHLVDAIANHIGEPEATVPGIVTAGKWHPEATVQDTSHLNPTDQNIYDELLNGTSQRRIDKATPARSPIGGIIFGALGTTGVGAQGSEGAKELSGRLHQMQAAAREQGVEDPFTDPTVAREYLSEVRSRIGDNNFRTITTELARVARFYQDDPVRGGGQERIAALTALGGGIIEYTD